MLDRKAITQRHQDAEKTRVKKIEGMSPNFESDGLGKVEILLESKTLFSASWRPLRYCLFLLTSVCSGKFCCDWPCGLPPRYPLSYKPIWSKVTSSNALRSQGVRRQSPRSPRSFIFRRAYCTGVQILRIFLMFTILAVVNLVLNTQIISRP